jgi:hypothetical protein
MTWQTVLAIIAIGISAIALWYARAATSEAKKGNDIIRLNALIALRSHYLELARCCAANIEVFEGRSAQKEERKELENLNQKLHEVSHGIDDYHEALVHRST